MKLKFKRHYRLVMALIVFVTFLMTVAGNTPIVAYMAY
jgi:hypothetical protein